MPWNGSGTFNRIFSWQADKAAGLDISSSRMDTDTNDLASAGFGNCITRDGQGQPTANLPMAGFRHTGVANAQNRNEYASLAQAQDGLIFWSTDTGSSTAYAITLTPAIANLNDGQLCYMRAANTNTTTTPTFAPNGLTAHTITKTGGVALALGDIQALQECELRYNLANTRWELLNPSNITTNQGIATTGAVMFTLASSAPSGWLIFDDGTFGSATSGSSNSNSVLNLALFTIMFNNVSDTNAPLFTSTGAGTTRAGQGTAAAAWAANCRMSLPKTLGRALSVAGSGSGLTTRALGATFGEETHLLSTPEIPSHNHGVTDPGHVHSYLQATGTTPQSGSATPVFTSNSSQNTGSSTTGISIQNAGGGGTHNNMQPSSFLNAIVKQ